MIRLFLSPLLVIVACALAAPFAHAETHTWGGGSLFTSNWNDFTNWIPPVVPYSDGSDLIVFGSVFPGARLTSTVNVNHNINALLFEANDVTISPSSFTINGPGDIIKLFRRSPCHF